MRDQSISMHCEKACVRQGGSTHHQHMWGEATHTLSTKPTLQLQRPQIAFRKIMHSPRPPIWAQVHDP